MQLVSDNDISLKVIADNWLFDLDKHPEVLEQDLIKLMIESNGIGLSANQVGILKRVFSVHLQNHPTINQPLAMFNPRLISASKEEVLGLEGCLSFPNLWLEIKRPKYIEVQYFDKNAQECKLSLSDTDARCFLHELDHLNGICFVEKVSKLKLNYAIKKQRKVNGRTKRQSASSL